MTRIRVWLLILMVLAMMLFSCAFAGETPENSCGENTTWEIQDGHVLVISGTGPMADYASNANTPWYDHLLDITVIEVNEGVTRIGDHVFDGATQAAYITLPDSVTEIGDYSFRNCTEVSSITLPGQLSEIGEYTFYQNTKLQGITIPDSVTSIGQRAFSECENLVRVTLCSCLDQISDHMFAQCWNLREIEIPEGVEQIGLGAFVDCTALKSVTIPSSLTSIGDNAFVRCNALTEILIPNTVTHIGTGVFAQDTIRILCYETSTAHQYASSNEIPFQCLNAFGEGLNWFAEGDTLHILGTGAIPDYDSYGKPWASVSASIANVEIAEGVTRIGNNAFRDCSQIAHITVPASVTQFGDNVVPEKVRYKDSLFFFTLTQGSDAETYCIQNGMEYVYGNLPLYTCQTLQDDTVSITKYNGHRQDDQYAYTIPSVLDGHAVTSIGDYAFSGLLRKSIDVPEGITSIGDYAFQGCTSISLIRFPESLASIGAYAFDGCSNMIYSLSYKSAQETCEISGNLQSIGEGAFRGCNRLSAISIMSGLTSIPADAFANCRNLSSIRIMDSVTEIADSAFDNCPVAKVYTTPGSVADLFFTDTDVTLTYTLKSGDYQYELSDNGAANITGYTGTDESITVPAVIDDLPISFIAGFAGNTHLGSVVISDGIQGINRNAFADCSNLTSITIPESVTGILGGAFSNCTSLVSIHLPSGLTGMPGLFQGCTSLTDVNIPDSVQRLDDTFYGCTSLQDIRIPSGVTTIGPMTFYQCANLQSISLPDTLTEIGAYAFDWCQSLSLYVPESVTTIGTDAFRFGVTQKIYCHENSTAHTFAVQNNIPFELVTVHDSTTVHWTVEDGTTLRIYGTGAIPDWKPIIEDEDLASSITAIVIESGITRIGGNPFTGMKNVTSLQIPDTVTSIGGYVFGPFESIVPIIPATVTEIDQSAFAWCSVSDVIIAADNPNYTCVDGVLYNKDMTTLIACLGGKQTPLVVPATVERFMPRALDGATGVTVITVSEQNQFFSAQDNFLLNKTGDTLLGCYCGINRAEIPDGVTTIAESAFYNVFNLATVSIPASVQSICDGAFAECKRLGLVLFSGTIAEWNSIAIGLDNNLLSAATLHCSPGHRIIAFDNCYEWGNLTKVNWFVDDIGVLTICGTGPIPDWNTIVQDIDIAATVREIVIQEGVTRIGGNPFQNLVNVENIRIPASVTSIGGYVFLPFSDIVPSIPATVTEIDHDAFAWSYIGSVNIVEDNPDYTCVDGVLYNKEMTTLILCLPAKQTPLIIPQTVTSIGDNANIESKNITDVYFCGTEAQWNAVTIGTSNDWLANAKIHYDCSTGICGYYLYWIKAGDVLTISHFPQGLSVMYSYEEAYNNDTYPWGNDIVQIDIEDGVLGIGDYAFAGQKKLQTVNMSSSVNGIGLSAFSGCSSLKNISVSEDNPYLKTENGVLFNKAGTELILYPGGLSGNVYTVPKGVVSIRANAFYSYANLAEVRIPASVQNIAANAFWHVENLVMCCEPDSTALQYAIDNQFNHMFGGVCGDNLTWEIRNGVLAISGTGPMYDYGWRPTSDETGWYPETPWIAENWGAIEPLSAVVLPEGLTVIGENAFHFYGPTYYSSPEIPSTVTRIAKDGINGFYYAVFHISAALTSIDPIGRIDAASFTVDSENPVYSAKDGVLYSKDQQVLIRYPMRGESGSFEVPSTVVAFEEAAFKPDYLQLMVIPADTPQISLNNVVDLVQSITILGMDTVLDSDDGEVTFDRTAPLKLRFHPYSSAQAYADMLAGKTAVVCEYIPFDNTLSLPTNTAVIESEAFADLCGYVNVEIPENVTSIADDAFARSKVLLIVTAGSEGEAFAIRNSIPYMDRLRYPIMDR